MTQPDQRALPCGADLDALTMQVVERTPPLDPEHQSTCTHCRAALAELLALWSPVHALVDERVSAPRDLVERVLAQIQDLDHSGSWAVIPGAGGDTAIGVRVIAVVARRAAHTVDGTLLAMTRASTGVEVGAVGRSIVVRLDLIAAMGLHLPTLSAQIQQTVAQHVSALTGLNVVAVDVSVVEVVERSAAPDPG